MVLTRCGSVCPFIVTILLLSGCASQMSQEEIAQARKYHDASDRVLQDNLNQVAPRDADETFVKDALKTIKYSYEHCDKTLLLKLFSRKYKLLYGRPPSKVIKFDRKDYFSNSETRRLDPTECSKLKRKAIFSNIKITRSSRNELNVVMLSRYVSKYFSPKFLEIVVFRRIGRTWVVAGQIRTPLYPPKPEFHKAELYIADLSKFEAIFKNASIGKFDDADILFQSVLKSGSYSKLPVDGVLKAILVLFKEPPLPGTSVQVSHEYFGFGHRRTRLFTDEYQVKSIQPWFYYVSASNIIDKGYVTYQLRVNGKILFNKSVETE